MEVDQHMGQRERTARGKKGDKGGGAKAGKYGKQGQWSQPGQWGQQGNWWNDFREEEISKAARERAKAKASAAPVARLATGSGSALSSRKARA